MMSERMSTMSIRLTATAFQRRLLPTFFAVGLLVGGAGTMPARAADDVSVVIAYTAWSQQMGLYVAKAKGFYKDVGLNVEIRPNAGPAAQIVGTGQATFGQIDPAAAIAARAQGIPVAMIGNLSQDNGAALFAREAANINKIEDLKGKNVGIFTNSQTAIFLQALLNKHGMSLNDIKPVTVRSGTDLPLVQNGGIDAEVTIYNNELVAWKILYPELKLKIWRLRDIGFDTPGAGLVASDKLLKENPDLVKRFMAATMKGLDYAIKNPEEAVKLLVSEVPGLKPELETAKWGSMLSTVVSPYTDKNGLGAMDPAKWDLLKKVLLEYKVITKDVDLKEVMRGEFLK